MKGHDASIMMKKVSPDTKIVLLTGYSNSGDEKIDKEYERVLLKPIHPEMIIKTISEILG
jgi:CheY-like chemotaxis protein